MVVSAFQIEALRQLTDQQVRFAPPARRLEQLSRAERLLAEVDIGKNYPYQFVCFRITDFRPDPLPQRNGGSDSEGSRDLLIPGEDLQHDLGLFISRLAESMPAMPAEKVDGAWCLVKGNMDSPTTNLQPPITIREPVLTLEEMSKRLNVTTKTLNRWRKRGLIGLPVLFGGRRQVGFLPSLVDPFLTANQDRVERGRRFSQLSPDEKDDILRRARRMAQVPTSTLTEVSRRIARRLGRSAETIRYTIKNFDREHPEQALFPEVTSPLDPETKQLIYNCGYLSQKI
jgi:RNA polymerase primary sigma factor